MNSSITLAQNRLVLALVSKAVKVAQGVISLIDAGLPEEAFGLSRTIVEIALSLRFITNRHSERRARRFVHYVGKWKIHARTLALEADGHEKVNGAPVNWQFDYEWVYSWTSQFVHATAACIDSHVAEPGQPFLVHIAPYRNHVDDSALFNTALCVYKILRMALPAIGQPFPPELSEPLERLLQQIAEAG